MRKTIAYVNIPAFYIEYCRARDSFLKNRPVILANGSDAFAKVCSLSKEAAILGLKKGMNLSAVKEICRDLHVLHKDCRQEKKSLFFLQKVLSRYSPCFEQFKPGNIFLDMTGTEKLWGGGKNTGLKIQHDIKKELMLDCRIGMGSNKLVSKIAAKSLDMGGLKEIGHGKEKLFLANFPVRVLPSIKRLQLEKILNELNLFKVGEIQQIPICYLESVFGKDALKLKQESVGIENQPVYPHLEKPEIVKTYSLVPADNNDERLLQIISLNLEKVFFELRSKKISACEIILELIYSDGKTIFGRHSLCSPSRFDHEVYDAVSKLFFKICKRRVKLKSVRIILRKFSSGEQLVFFKNSKGNPIDEKWNAVTKAIDKIRIRGGFDAIKTGRSIFNNNG